jgi:hypothetical protein
VNPESWTQLKGLNEKRILGGRGQVPDTGADTGNQILCMNPRPIPVSLSN